MKRLNLAEWAIRHRQIIYFFIILIVAKYSWSLAKRIWQK